MQHVAEEVSVIESILFVAVSQAMANVAAQAASELKVELPIIVARMSDVENWIKNYDDIDVFISRGGAAQALSKKYGKTVAEITSTVDDFLEPIQKICSEGIQKIGVVAHEGLISKRSFKILGAEIYMCPWKEQSEQEQMIEQLVKSGIKGVVGGLRPVEIAKSRGIATEILDSGQVSIKRAINEAVKISRAQQNERIRAAENANQTKQRINEFYASIQQAVAAVQELTASSQELAARSKEAAGIAKTAFEDVNSTSEILEIIKRVAQQTNLLGLNAAIEAARAGEYGRGFSVVAGEIRKLADESDSSAKKINQMLTKFQGSVGSVLEIVEDSDVITQEQASATQEISRMLQNIDNLVEKLSEL